MKGGLKAHSSPPPGSSRAESPSSTLQRVYNSPVPQKKKKKNCTLPHCTPCRHTLTCQVTVVLQVHRTTHVNYSLQCMCPEEHCQVAPHVSHIVVIWLSYIAFCIHMSWLPAKPRTYHVLPYVCNEMCLHACTLDIIYEVTIAVVRRRKGLLTVLPSTFLSSMTLSSCASMNGPSKSVHRALEHRYPS